MSEAKVPIKVDGGYAIISLSHHSLPEEAVLSALRAEVDFDDLRMDLDRHWEVSDEND